MSDWSLAQLLESLHADIEGQLSIARKSFAHPGVKGDASEGIWRELLSTYLPKRYAVEKAHVVDSEGTFSEQIDIVIFDRQYSPFIFTLQDQKIIPAESVYAVFEAKQSLNAALVQYALKKCASVRKLHRTSLPIPHAGGTYPAKPLGPIIGGVLSLESEWTPAFSEAFENAVRSTDELSALNIGCIASHGIFSQRAGSVSVISGQKPATAFLFELIALLQELATVPMIDVRAYARWLNA